MASRNSIVAFYALYCMKDPWKLRLVFPNIINSSKISFLESTVVNSQPMVKFCREKQNYCIPGIKQRQYPWLWGKANCVVKSFITMTRHSKINVIKYLLPPKSKIVIFKSWWLLKLKCHQFLPSFVINSSSRTG
jgi:hypothetical protein